MRQCVDNTVVGNDLFVLVAEMTTFTLYFPLAVSQKH